MSDPHAGRVPSINHGTRRVPDTLKSIMIEPNRQGEVWVFAEQEDGSLHDVSLELCGRAAELAARLGVKTGAVLPGHNVEPMARQLIAQGIDTVYATDDARLGHFQTGSYARVLSTLIEKHRPQIVMYGATAMGRDLAPRVASTIQAGMTADCTELDISDVTDPEDQAGAPEPPAANPPRLRRQHHRHDRQLRLVAADGHGPRGRDGHARARPEPHGQGRARGRSSSTRPCWP